MLTGNLDREGGALFTRAAAGQKNSSGAGGSGRGVRFGRWQSRVRGLHEFFGELPVSVLAEEIETPGEGQVRALITVAGNPIVSTPNSERLERAVEGLDFMLSIDIYVNETTRHADVILPAPEPLEKSHYDVAFYQLSARNIANFSPAVFDRENPAEWEIYMRIAGDRRRAGPERRRRRIRRHGHPDGDPARGRERGLAGGRARPERAARGARAAARPGAGARLPAADRSVRRRLRRGPGRAHPRLLEQNPHGIDLGPLSPRLPEVLRTPSGKVELAPEPIVADMDRLRAALARERNGGMVLIGRRQLRSNNSWMHNLPALVKGKDRCTLHIHPDDAERLGLGDGEMAVVRSAAGSVAAPIEVTEDIMPGVVSIPHGWGHDADGVRMNVASAHAGVNSNVLADESQVEPLSGNAVLNGIPVELDRLEHGAAAVAADHVGGV